MRNKDYTKYSEKSDKDNNIIKELEETVLRAGGDVMRVEQPEEPTNVEPETEIIEEGDAKLTGVVDGCTKLNVRKEPYKDAEVLCVINKGEEVVFDTEEEATYEYFYKIVTATGVKGYCMKQFINIK